MRKHGFHEPTTKEVTGAIVKVDKCLKMAKFDDTGMFNESRIDCRKRIVTEAPDYWEKLIALKDDRYNLECLVVSILVKEDIGLYHCDLFLSSHDLNYCNFRKELCSCLVKETSVIYIEVSSLTSRGNARLLQLLSDCRALFDKRVTLIIFSKCALPQDVLNLTHVSLDYSDSDSHGKTPTKRKNPEIHDRESPTAKKRIQKLEDELKDANQRINMLEKEVNMKIVENIELKEEFDSRKREFEIKLQSSHDQNCLLRKKECELQTELKICHERIFSYENALHNKNVEGSLRDSLKVTVKDTVAAEKLKDLIRVTQEKFPDATAMEIIRRTFKLFQFIVTFSDKVYAKDDFECTLRIVDIDSSFHYYTNTEWVGKGRSKKISKNDAFSLLLADMKA